MSTTYSPTSPPPAIVVSPNPPPNPPARSPFAKKPAKGRWASLIWKLGLALAALAAAGWGARHWLVATKISQEEITATAKRANLPIIVSERGDLESSKTIDVRCQVEGYQNKIATIVAEGTKVTKGQVVVTFDADQLNRDYATQEVKWQQAIGKEKAAKGELEVQKNKAETDIDKADLALKLARLDLNKYEKAEFKVEQDKRRGDIELAKKDLKEAEDKLEKFRKFVRQGFGTPEQQTVKELEVAQKRFVLSSKEADLRMLEDFVRDRQITELKAKARDAERELVRAKATAEASIDKAKSEYEAAKVATQLEKQALDRLKRQLDNCIVKAPADGILVYSKERWWDDNSRIQAGSMIHYQQGLFSLPDLTQMQVKVRIHEAMVKKVKQGQPAELRFDAYPNHVLHGTVQRVATLANSESFYDRSVREYETIVSVDGLPDDAGLKPGMSGEVKILVNELKNVLVVPVQAVGQKGGQHRCYVVTDKGIELREIVVGENNEKFVEVKEGLEEGERVTLDARARITLEGKANEGKGDDLPSPTNSTPAAPVPTAKPSAVAVSPAS